MTIQAQVALRSRKLGVLIRDARLAARKTIPECAQQVGVAAFALRSWEEGLRAPSLPELELLAYSIKVPISHFWSQDVLSEETPLAGSLDLPFLLDNRQHAVGDFLRQKRENAGLSLRMLSEQSGVSLARLKAYELGGRPIPLPELEGLLTLLGGQMEAIFDHDSPIGEWMNKQKVLQDISQLPPEIQDFVSKPENIPYLKMAMKFKGVSLEKLRSLGSHLLRLSS
jgi:transcriptional regulator with XRE-family HTH domain